MCWNIKQNLTRNTAKKKSTSSIKLKFLQGGATLQVSWTTNPNSWALTSFVKLNAPSFDSKKV